MTAKIVTFGEIMLRLSPPDYERISQASQFQIKYGGGEANVAASLAQFGHDSYFVSCIPDNLVGDAAVNMLHGLGVNTEYILRSGKRLGIYFLEHGASIRPSKVVYDRTDSAISQITTGRMSWNKIFGGTDWYHTTGITPALSPSAAAASLEAIRVAREMGITTSCDLNYRKKLWSKDEARETMSEMVKNVDIIIANEEDADNVFGIAAADSDIESGQLSVDGYKSVARQLIDISGAGKVAITLRESISASDNGWSAILFDGKELLTSRKYPIHIVDRVGGGDSFGAGLIHGLVNNWSDQESLEFAVAASAMKHTIHGDINLVTESEVMEVVKGNISGRVQR